MTDRQRAILALTGVNILWGSTFFLIKWSIDAVGRAAGEEAAAAAWVGFLAIRFSLSALATALVFPGALRRLRDAGLWRNAFWIALPGAAGHFLQTAGLVSVTPAMSAFLTSLYVPATPLAAWLLFRKRLAPSLAPAIAIALAGLWIMNPPTAPSFGVGELLSAACGLAFGIQIVTIDRLAPRHDTSALTLASSLWIGGAFAAGALATPAAVRTLKPAVLLRLAADTRGALPYLSLLVAATVVSLWVMNRFQKDLDPNHAAVVYATEPIFAAACSALFYGERFTAAAIAGGALIVAANVWAGKKS